MDVPSWISYRSFHAVPRGLLLVLFLSLLIYAPSLWNGFVWDDWDLVVGIEAYRTFDLREIVAGRASSLEYLPVRDLSLALDALLWGMHPAGFHLTNILLYLLSLVVLSVLLRDLAAAVGESRGELLSFWATLCFAVHPLHAEAVNFIAARNTLLAGLFLFLSAAAVLRGVQEQRGGPVAWALVFFALALLSKAVSVFFFAFIAIILCGIPTRLLSLRRRMIVILLFCAVGAAGAVMHRSVAIGAGIVNEEFLRFGVQSWQTKAVQAIEIPIFYLRMLFVPYPLSVHYAIPLNDRVFTAGVLVSLLLLAAVLGAAWIARKRAPMASIGVLWSLTSLLPVLNWLPTHPVVADRYAYFAVAGFAMVAANGIIEAGSRWQTAFVAAGILTLAGAAGTAARTVEWRSDTTLWRSAIAADPNAPRIQLAQALWREGKEDEALSLLAEERDRKGTHYASLYEGRRYLQQGAIDDALRSLQRSLAEGGDAFREVHVSLARVYEAKGDVERALASYLKAQETRDIDVNLRIAREAEDGVQRLRMVLAPRLALLRARAEADSSDSEMTAAYSRALYSVGLYDEAERFYRRALELRRDRWEIWYNLALVQMRKRSYPDAQRSFQQALDLHEDVNILNNLGVCSMHMRDYGMAEAAYRRAMELDPSFFYAAFNLARLHFVKGEKVPARQAFLAARELVTGNHALQSRIDQYLVQLH